MTSKTIALTGDETRVDYGCGTNVWLRNDGTDVIYASTSPGITAGADGTASIPAGQAMRIDGTCGTVCLLGTGSVQLVGSDYTACPFKTSAQSGGSGADEVARAAIEAHSADTDIHVTAYEKAYWNTLSGKNELDNPDFQVNQRGQAEYTGSTYTVDCWRKNAGGSVTIKDGKLILSADALIRQPMEYADKLSGQKVTVSIKANGTIRSKSSVFPTDTSSFSFYYDEDINITRYISDSAPWFVITARKEVSIEWVKLEVGGAATPFVSPDPATELAKCQRYLLKLSQWSAYRAVHSNVNYMEFAVPIPESMRISPTIIGGNNFAVYKFPSPVAAESDFTFSVSAASANELRVRATKAGHGLSDAALHVVGEDGVFLSAEL